MRDVLAELEEGSHPKLCSGDSDCITKGGWRTECRCGLDGYYYCVPEKSSAALDGYWKECDYMKNRTNDATVDSRVKEYYDFYTHYYVEIVSAPDCLERLLLEFKILGELEEFMNGSRGVVIGGLLFISVFV